MPEIKKSFTDKFVEDIKPTKTIQTYVDTKFPRLKVISRPSGKKSYYCRLKVNGKDIKRKVGEVGDISVSMARIMASSFVYSFKLQVPDSQLQESSIFKHITLNQVFDLYKEGELKHRRTIAGRAHGLEIAYKTHVKPKVGAMLINDITKKFARSFFKELEMKGYSVHNKTLSLLKAAFNYVIDFEEELKIHVNPFERIKKLQGITRNRYFTQDEARRFLRALDQVNNQDVADIYRLALYTGARLSNVKQMEWRELNLSAGVWIISATRTKTRQHYEIPLHLLALQILQNRQRKFGHSRFVFPSRNKSKYGYITGGDPIWKEAIILANLYHENPNIRPRPHDLRRTFATWQIQSGADVSVVSKALCHTSLKHTLIYAHTNVSQVRDAIDGAFKFLE